MNTSKLFNIEAEKEILGAVLNKNDVLLDIIDTLESTDFYQEKHILIFDTMKKLYSKNKQIDIITLSEALGKQISLVGGITYLSELLGQIISVMSIKNHAEIVKEKSNMRSLNKILGEAVKSIDIDNKNSLDIMTELQNKLLDIKDQSQNDNGSVSAGLEIVLKNLEKRYENQGSIQGVQTYLAEIDRVINGLNKQEFIILAARPSMGKSAVANNIALNTALISKAKVNMFSLEMSKEQLLERMLASVARIEMEKIKKGFLNDKEWTEIAKTTAVLGNPNLRIYDKIFSLNGIKAECKKRKLQDGLDVVIIDYLQLIQGGKSESRQVEVSDISRQLKLMSMELNCTVIALSQLSRACEARADHRPMLSDLRESGSIEQDADIVMFLYRDEYYNPQTEDKGIIENIIAKNRNGEVGTVKLTWIPRFQKVANYSGMREVSEPHPFKGGGK